MSATTDILPCPFCANTQVDVGCEPYYSSSMSESRGERAGYSFSVSCDGCKIQGPLVRDDQEEAVAAWNQRAQTAELVQPYSHCPICNAPRKDPLCQKCGTATITPCAGWHYPKLPPIEPIRALAREVGYAIGVHGSLERDLDLIAAPWTDEAVGNHALMEHIAKGLGASIIEIERKPLGRYAATLQMDGWFRPIDISVCPAVQSGIKSLEPPAK